MAPEHIDAIFSCPSCRQPLLRDNEGWKCESESFRFGFTQGIPDFLLDSRRPHIEEFLTTYRSVRNKEGWGSQDRSYYLALPYMDATGRHTGIWRLRAQSFTAFAKDLKRSVRPEARILDVGAGNGWLSHRLATSGYKVVAADINLDSKDGLLSPSAISDDGKTNFLRVRAEFDFLPFGDRSFDAIVFNASVHYSCKPFETTLSALKALAGDGVLYILDSPHYVNEKDGLRMLGEKTLDIESKSGLKLPEKHRGSFLTPKTFSQLSRDYALKHIEPYRGLRVRIRRYIGRILGARTPASFPIVRIQKHTASKA